MESDNPLIQKLRGLLPKTNPFIVTDLAHQLELDKVDAEGILSAIVNDMFFTRDRGAYIKTELQKYSSDPSASIFISTQMGNSIGSGYYEAHGRVVSKVLDQESKYMPLYRRIDLELSHQGCEKRCVSMYCLMGAAVLKPASDKAAES